MASQLATDIEEPPIPCARCGRTITLDEPINKLTLHSYPTAAPDETMILCPLCAALIWQL